MASRNSGVIGLNHELPRFCERRNFKVIPAIKQPNSGGTEINYGIQHIGADFVKCFGGFFICLRKCLELTEQVIPTTLQHKASISITEEEQTKQPLNILS